MDLALWTALLLCPAMTFAASRRAGPPGERPPELELRSELPSSAADDPVSAVNAPLENWNEETRARLSPAANKAFFKMMDLWSVDQDQARTLLGVSGQRYAELKTDPNSTLDHDSLRRISYLLGIYASLNTIFSEKDLADRWIRLPNRGPLFAGKSPLAHMLEGGMPAMEELRRYVDAVRWGN